jgi:hypothetical protein
MKIIIPINWGWYIAVIIIFGPIFLIWIVEPDWVARMVGMGLFFFIPPLICFWYAFGSKENLSSLRNGKNIWPDYIIKSFGGKVIGFVTRALIFVAGFAMCFFFTLPFTKDILLAISHKAPIERTAYVANTRSLSGNLSEEVTLNTYPQAVKEDIFTAWYFTPRHIVTGRAYKFLYIPNSHIILEAVEVSKN